MKRLAAIILTVIFVTIILPLVIVFVMEKTVDNNPPGGDNAPETVVETEIPDQ